MERVKKLKAEKRHIAKAITWRITGTLQTMLLAWVVVGDPLDGIKIGIGEIITKMTLYYFHERVWFNIDFPNSQRRHIYKTLTWRVVGTLDTMFVAWIISGDPSLGLAFGLLDIAPKMILYYLHERVWHKSNYGLETTTND